MNILIINPIMYSSENKRKVHKVDSIKDTLLYDLSYEFCKAGHNVVLYTTNIYKPLNNEVYPFDIIWDEPIMKSIFLPACLPYLKNLCKYLKKSNYDFIISSEIFQISTLMASIISRKKLIVWHETARHNHILNEIPSKIWYNVVTKVFMSNAIIVPRSVEAKVFIKKYCNKVQETPIEHGINEEYFIPVKQKNSDFIVIAQLIKRKHVEKIIEKFDEYLKITGEDSYLIICGDGEEKNNLVKQTNMMDTRNQIVFKGKLSHDEMIPLLSNSCCLLVNSEKENSMVSIIEAIAVGTPIITTEAPLNASYIRKNKLGIVDDNWTYRDMVEVASNHDYISNCLKYRKNLLNSSRVEQFCELYSKKLLSKGGGNYG